MLAVKRRCGCDLFCTFRATGLKWLVLPSLRKLPVSGTWVLTIGQFIVSWGGFGYWGLWGEVPPHLHDKEGL